MDHTLIIDGNKIPIVLSPIQLQSLPAINQYIVEDISYRIQWQATIPSIRSVTRSITRKSNERVSYKNTNQHAGGKLLNIILIRNDGVTIINSSNIALLYKMVHYSDNEDKVTLSYDDSKLIGIIDGAMINFDYDGTYIYPKYIQTRY